MFTFSLPAKEAKQSESHFVFCLVKMTAHDASCDYSALLLARDACAGHLLSIKPFYQNVGLLETCLN